MFQKSFRYVLDMFQICSRYVLDMFQICSRYVLDTKISTKCRSLVIGHWHILFKNGTLLRLMVIFMCRYYFFLDHKRKPIYFRAALLIKKMTGDPKPIQKYHHDATDFDMVTWMHYFIIPASQTGTNFNLVSQIKLVVVLPILFQYLITGNGKKILKWLVELKSLS